MIGGTGRFQGADGTGTELGAIRLTDFIAEGVGQFDLLLEDAPPPAAVPEPASALLPVSALGLLAMGRRRSAALRVDEP